MIGPPHLVPLYIYTFNLFPIHYCLLFFGLPVESAQPFQYGFDQAIKTAVSSLGYDRIIIDGKQDTLLMAYLFNTKYDPAKFQSMLPLPTVQPYSNVNGNQIDNVFLLFAGERTWRTIWNDGETGKKTLLIVANGQPDLELSNPSPPASPASPPSTILIHLLLFK